VCGGELGQVELSQFGLSVQTEGKTVRVWGPLLLILELKSYLLLRLVPPSRLMLSATGTVCIAAGVPCRSVLTLIPSPVWALDDIVTRASPHLVPLSQEKNDQT
jgi:hypothetical protein